MLSSFRYVVISVIFSVPNSESILVVAGSNPDLKQPRAGDEKQTQQTG